MGALSANLEAGVDAQWQDNQSQRYRTVARVRGAQLRDWDYDLRTRGAYVQAVLTPIERLQVVPGYRLDRVDGQLHDVRAGLYAPTYDYGTIKQPKFSASYRLVGQSSMYANWGVASRSAAAMARIVASPAIWAHRSTTAGRPVSSSRHRR